MKKRRPQIPLYNQHLNIWFGSLKEIKKEFYRIFDKDLPHDYFVAYVDVYEREVFIFFNEDYKEYFTYGLIAHEALHAICEFYYKIIDTTLIGNSSKEMGSEKDCYFLGWIVEEILKVKEIKKIINKNK